MYSIIFITKRVKRNTEMDMERYGDYTEYEDDIPKSKSKFLLVMKILVAVVCFSVVGLIAFRLIVFNYYPASVENIYFTDNLKSYYEKTDGDIGAKTQELRFPYDDPDVANFFCENLIVVEGAGELQFSVRYNLSTLENIKLKCGLTDLNPDDTELFSFRLVASRFDAGAGDYKEVVISDSPSYVGMDSFMMYRYYKLAFDGIDLANPPVWIRVEIFVKGQKEDKAFAMVPIYENNESYAVFEDYDLKRKERPE